MHDVSRPRAFLPAILLLGAAFPAAARAQSAHPDVVLRPGDVGSGDHFGFAVDLDGERAVVGVLGDDGPLQTDSGSVRVEERRSDGTWDEVAVIQSADGVAGDHFGYAVGLDGDRLVVGAPGDDDGGSSSGSAYVFERDALGVWRQTAKLVAPDAALGDFLGRAVAIDGDTIVAGAQLDDDGGFNSGSASVFVRGTGGAWSFAQKLVAPDAAADDRFGAALAIGSARILVGAPLADASGVDTGAAYVFVPQAPGAWAFEAKLTLGTAGGGESFGSAVDVDGDHAAVGAPHDGGGTAHLFERTLAGAWESADVFALANGAPGDEFGASVALRGDRVLAGAPGRGSRGGAALFARSATTWYDVAEFAPPTSATGDGFGVRVALGPDRLVVGMDGDANDGGALAVTELGTLLHGELELSASTGGTSALLLRAGEAHAGHLFVVLGSLTGTGPTFDPPSGLLVPLTVDAYTLLLVERAGAGLLAPWVGVLDAHGRADSAFLLPAGTNPSFVGAHLRHACLCVDLGPFVADLATNAVTLEIVP